MPSRRLEPNSIKPRSHLRFQPPEHRDSSASKDFRKNKLIKPETLRKPGPKPRNHKPSTLNQGTLYTWARHRPRNQPTKHPGREIPEVHGHGIVARALGGEQADIPCCYGYV